MYRLGAPPLFDQDEGNYAQIAAEIVQTGDPVTLHVNGRAWYVHPPFYMWLVAATGRVLGFSEWAVRIWSAVFSIVAVYATVLLGRAMFGGRVGLLAGAILTVTLQYLIQSRLAVFDTVLLAWMLLAVHAFYRGYETRRGADYLRFFLFADYGYPSYANTMATTADFLKANPEAGARFTRASVEGWRNYLRDPSAGNRLIQQQNPRMDDEQLAYGLTKIREVKAVDGADAATMGIGIMTRERWQKTRDFLVDVDLLKADVDWTQVFTTEYVRDLKITM